MHLVARGRRVKADLIRIKKAFQPDIRINKIQELIATPEKGFFLQFP